MLEATTNMMGDVIRFMLLTNIIIFLGYLPLYTIRLFAKKFKELKGGE